jgi:hypothetical protein
MRGFAPCGLCVGVQAGPGPGVVLPQQKEAAGASIAPADLLNPVGGTFRERAPNLRSLDSGVRHYAADVGRSVRYRTRRGRDRRRSGCNEAVT